MLTKTQMDILSVFFGSPFASLTFREIKERSGQKSNNIMQISLKRFRDEGIIGIEKIADVYRYSLSTESGLTLGYMNLINEYGIKKRKMPRMILDSIQKRISRETPFFILLLFGSRAKGTSKRASDIDIAVIVCSEKTKSAIAPALETIKRRELKKVDYHIFSETEFLEMLNDEMENVGKQIYKSGIVLHGFISYINLIKGANL